MKHNGRLAWILGALLVCGFLPAQAQQDEQAEQLTPKQLLRDAELLSVVSRLGLTPRQAAKFVAALREVQKALRDVEALREGLAAERADDFEAVRKSYIARTEPPQDVVRRIDAAWAQIERAEEQADEGISALEGILLGALTRDQVALVETEQQHVVRERRREQFEGAATAAEFVVNKLKEVRDLLPEEYAQQAARLTRDVAAAVGAGGGRRGDPVRQRLAYLFEQVRAMSQEDWNKALETAEEDVVKLLDLPQEQQAAPEGAIGREEFRQFVRDPRTPPVLQQWLQRQPSEEGEQP